VFLAVGLSFAAMTYAVVREFRRRRSQPLHERRPVAVGGAVVPFDRVRFARKLQIGSSSPELVARHPVVHTFSSAEIHSTVESATSTRSVTHGRGAISRCRRRRRCRRCPDPRHNAPRARSTSWHLRDRVGTNHTLAVVT